MTTYPSPQERLEIIAKRRQLLDELNSVLAKVDPVRENKEIKHLINRYGFKEVQRILRIIQRQSQTKDVQDDAVQVYKRYLEIYHRFGGQRPLLEFDTFNELTLEFTKLFAQELFNQSLSRNQKKRLDKLTDLMFQDYILWDDITPEDPPATMREIDVSTCKPSNIPEASNMPETIALAQGTVPACKRDGFPMLRINGRLRCVVEYLNRFIGQEKIVDVIKQGEAFYYVFANGYQLPLLCSCCNGPLVIENLIKTRQNMLGRRLVAMAMETNRFEDGRVFEELVLEFSKKRVLSKKEEIGVSFEVAVHLKHPAKGSGASIADASRSLKKKKSPRKKKRKKSNCFAEIIA